MVEQCESCGREGEVLFFVRRLFVTPETWDSPESVDEGDDEWWCYVCRTHYPHRELDQPPHPG